MTQAMATQAGQGEARWWFAGLAEIKATAEDTGRPADDRRGD